MLQVITINGVKAVFDEETGEVFPIPCGAEDDGDGEGGEGKEGNDGGVKGGAWRAQLPDDLKEDKAFTKFEKLGDLGKEYLNLLGKSANSIQLPGDNTTDEERATFFNKLGRPENPGGYGLVKPELPEDMPYNEALEKEFREEAHKLGLSDQQAKGLFSWYHQNMTKANAEFSAIRERNHKEAMETMQKEWGNKFDENIELGRRAVNTFGGDELKQVLDESGLGDHPVMVKVFFNIAKKVGDDKLISGAPPKGDKTGLLDKIYPTMEEEKQEV